ncbi:prepilin peptidase [Streptomyces montanisoli]|uniref:Prepilin peptidase n=1 Tax=Streptomyces montanisoli TaxID=2798581 RepID=A0A940MC73_9ACTN|nr:A24 family peptidase [Streptomyces montanisoli]MBP0458233.1 prepilin peptidase [Streptomyces montanisoli]
MYVSLIAVALLWGAAAGALLPRAVYRLSVETGESWRAACPGGHSLAGAGGWVGCAVCGRCPPGPTGARRAVAPAAVTACACGALAAATGPRPELAVWLLLAPFAALLAAVDLAVRRLPDQLTLPLAAATPLLLGAAALAPAHGGSWPTALLGGLALGACYFVLFLVNPNGLGFGDVKLALPLGCALGWYGWPVLVAGAFAGFLFGAVYGVGLMVLRRAGRKAAIPFGPFMIAGTLAGLLVGGLAASGQ